MTSLACPPDASNVTRSPSAPPPSTTDHGQPTTDDLRAARNRRNAAKSTGPKTPEGKKRSAQNARTHGLTAATPPPDQPVPDPCASLEFTTSLNELVDEHRPATPTQHALVKELALVLWKLDYVPRLEHRLLNTPLETDVPEPDPASLTPHPRLDHPADPTARVLAAHFAADRPTPLTRLFAYHHRLQARMSSLLNQLRRCKRDQRTQHDDDTGETWRRAYDRRNNTPAARAGLEDELRRIHHDNQLKAEAARRDPANTCPSAPNPANARQTTPSDSPAQNEPNSSPSVSSVSSVSSVAEHSLPTTPQSATPRNTAQQHSPPAQNEPTTHNGPQTMDNPPPIHENTPMPSTLHLPSALLVLLLSLLPLPARAQQRAATADDATATRTPTTAKVDYSHYKERWVTLPRVPNPLLAHKSYHSAAMNTEVGYHIYLPPQYADPANATRRFPVLYWLHGLNQSESSNWYPPQLLDDAVRSAKVPPMIVVFVSGGGRTFYVDSPDGKLLSETTLIKELIPHIDATYRTIASRDGRAIQGMSMGGWGALRLAFAHPDLFSSVAAFAPSLRQPDNLAATYPDVLSRMFAGDPQRFWAQHPLHLARQNADVIRKDLPIAFYCGTADSLLPGSQNLHHLLTDLKIDHTYVEVDGAVHNMTQLVAVVKTSNLTFAASHFKLQQN